MNRLREQSFYNPLGATTDTSTGSMAGWRPFKDSQPEAETTRSELAKANSRREMFGG
jgi:hypothetical protein